MDFGLSEDQRAFGESARSLFADHCSDDQLRQHDTRGAPYMQALWPACVAMGLHSVLVPESAGGLGQGLTELMPVLEAQGRALALVPLWEHQLAAAAVARFGTAALAGRLLPAAMDGSSLLTASLGGVAGPRAASLMLSRQGEGWCLNGRVAAVPLGSQARHALLAATSPDDPGTGTRLVLLDLAQAGVTPVPGVSQHHLAVADLHIDSLALPDESVLAPESLAWFEPRAIACLATLQVGVTAAQLQQTVRYVSERRQFGRAVGTFQLVAGQMADGHIALEALRSALWQLVYRLDAGLHALPQALALRVLACESAHRTGHMAQHVHGGMGVDITYPIHRFLYWSRALGSAQGGTEAHLSRLGDWLADNDSLGWKYDLPEPAPDGVPAGAAT